MDEVAYQRFSSELTEILRADPDVLGLIALGSMADLSYRDDWSDHDFWVITRPGHQDALLEDISWLPGAGGIFFSVRHGRRHYSVLYRDGHMVEFAVFDPDEAAQGTVNTFRVLFERDDVTALAAHAQERSRPAPWDAARYASAFDNFLLLLRTAVARYRRGERLSGQRYVSQFALDALLRLVLELSPAGATGAPDRLDPRRRFEQTDSELAAELEELARHAVPEAAVRLLDIAERTLAPAWPAYPAARAAAIRSWLRVEAGVTPPTG